MAQQTALDVYIDKMNKFFDDAGVHCGLRKNDEIYIQAKQIEKEQIMDAIINNQNGLLRRKTIIEAEQYYNETYKR